MKIVVTGARGFLGRCLLGIGGDHEWIGWSRVAGQVESHPCCCVDLTDGTALLEALRVHRPDWVIHAAAMTDVDGCERDPAAGRAINVDTVAHLAAACRATETGLVHVSTDYVFDGASGPYREGDTPRPLSTYGALKLESEGLVLGQVERGIVVRTMWLYGYVKGARPNMITWPLETLARGASLRIVADQWGNPTYGPDLARALLGLCETQGTGLWHMGGGSFMTRREQVVELATFFGLDAECVLSTTTAELGQPAKRPLRSGLCTEAVEQQLGWAPMSFIQSLNDLLSNEHFYRDYGHLIECKKT